MLCYAHMCVLITANREILLVYSYPSKYCWTYDMGIYNKIQDMYEIARIEYATFGGQCNDIGTWYYIVSICSIISISINNWNIISITGLLISWDGDGERDKYIWNILGMWHGSRWNRRYPDVSSIAGQNRTQAVRKVLQLQISWCLWQFVAPEKSVKITVDRWFMPLIIGFQHVSTIQSRVMLLNDIALW